MAQDLLFVMKEELRVSFCVMNKVKHSYLPCACSSPQRIHYWFPFAAAVVSARNYYHWLGWRLVRTPKSLRYCSQSVCGSPTCSSRLVLSSCKRAGSSDHQSLWSDCQMSDWLPSVGVVRLAGKKIGLGLVFTCVATGSEWDSHISHYCRA